MLSFTKLLLLTIIISIVSCQNAERTSEVDHNSTSQEDMIQIGIIDHIESNVLGQERTLAIYLPESARDPNRKKQQYPVVYLLDGRYPFVPFVGMLKQYSEMNGTEILPEMIVVAIDNIDNNSRMMDFSPTTDGKPEKFGGGDKFLQFIKTELFPYIEKKYPGSQHRTLIGHSFGGLAVMNALTTQPEMFDNYLMIDGSLYFDNEIFLKNSKYSLKQKDLKNKNLYIAIANTATYGSTLESIKTDTISANKYVRHSLELVRQIEQMDTDLNMKWKYYDKDTHGSTAYLATMDALRFFYSWYEFKEEHKYRSKYYFPKSEDDHFATLAKNHFKKVSSQMGYEFKPEQTWLSNYAYSMFSFHNQPEQAIETYKLAIEYYPNSANTHKNLADFYLSQHDTIPAINYYTKALELDDDSKVHEKLRNLKATK